MTETVQLTAGIGRLAENSDVDGFIPAALRLIADATGHDRLAYWLASARLGMHFHFELNTPPQVAESIRANWASSPLTMKMLQHLGLWCSLTDVLSEQEILEEPFIQDRFAESGLYIRGMILFPNFSPGIVDTLTVFDESYAAIPVDEANLLREGFMAMRFGFLTILQNCLKEKIEDAGLEAGEAAIVDEQGYFYAGHEYMVPQLKARNSDLVYEGSNPLFDPPVMRVENSAIAKHLQFEPLVSGLRFVKFAGAVTSLDHLSPRELQVAKAIAQGHPYKTIGSDLNIATSTVSNIASRLKDKLGVSSRAEVTSIVRDALSL